MVKAPIGGASGDDEGRLVDLLIVPGAAERRLTGNDDKRDTGAHRRRKRRHKLCDPGAAGYGGDPNPSSFAGIGHGRGHSTMLVADMDHPRA